jgi:hypothetical protein
MFHVAADADAQMPLRLLTPLSRCGLLPDHVRMVREDGVLHVEIGVSTTLDVSAERFAEALRRVVGVRTVRTSIGSRGPASC